MHGSPGIGLFCPRRVKSLLGKSYYQRYKAEGRCVSCGAPPPLATTQCEKCRVRRNASRAKDQRAAVVEGRCRNCGRKNPTGGVLCPECKERAYRANRRRRRTYLSKNLCGRCGKRECLFGITMCAYCSDKDTEKSLKRYHADPDAHISKVRERYRKRRTEGVCVECGREATEGTAYCAGCLANRRSGRSTRATWDMNRRTIHYAHYPETDPKKR